MKANFFKTIALSILALFFLAPSHTKAQVANPYKIVNNTPCKIDIKYEFFEKNPNTGFCDLVCASGALSLPPGASIPVPSCPITCGVRISIYAANGVIISPPIVAAFGIVPPMPSTASGADPSGCSPTGKIRLNVGPGLAQITP